LTSCSGKSQNQLPLQKFSSNPKPTDQDFNSAQKQDTPQCCISLFCGYVTVQYTTPAQETGNNVETLDPVTEDEPQLVNKSSSMTSSVDSTSQTTVMPSQTPKFMDHFIHVLQFCHLCHLGKISPVVYQVSTNIEVKLGSFHLNRSTICCQEAI